MKSLRLSWRLSRREWRSGELRVLLFALITAIAATTTISFFTERLGLALLAQSAELIGGDLVLRSSRPLNKDWLNYGQELGLETAEVADFGSVLVYSESILLSRIKAVSDSYPIRGKVRLADSIYGQDYAVDESPQPGQVWVDRRVLNRMGLEPGESVNIGMQSFVVSKVLTFEPDQSGNLFNLAPRVIMNLQDLAATQVVQPGSRVNYSYLFAGEATTELSQWLKPKLETGQRLMDIRSERGTASRALENTEQYLRLISLMAIVLAAVAIAVTTQSYSQRHYDVSAMLRCLGASQRNIVAIYLGQLIIIAVIAALVGSILGWLTQSGLILALSELMPVGLPAAGFRPVATGLITGVIILLGTALPPILRLKQVSPLRVIRRNLKPLPISAWLVYLVALAAIALLIVLLSRDVVLTLLIFAVIALIAVLLYLLVYVLMRSNPGQYLVQGSFVARGLASLSRRSRSNSGQVIAFSITIMLMLVIAMLRTQLLDNWQTQLPEDAPNHFAFNIQPADKDAFQQKLLSSGVDVLPVYPMVRGRLTKLNGEPIKRQVEHQDRTERTLNRELNLTWSSELPPDNRIVSGQWWGETDTNVKGSEPAVSVEYELAQRLNLSLGDQLEFNIAGKLLQATITSFRTVQWESFSPNFFMIFQPGSLDTMPATYITSFRMEAQNNNVLVGLVREFPAVTVLEVDVIIQQLRRILQQVTLAVEAMLMFVLLAGFAVLFSAVQTSLGERLREGALMRALGARRKYIAQNNLIEFAILGFLSGLLAVLGAEAVNSYLYNRLFQIERDLVVWIWWVTPLLSSIFIALVGYYSTRKTVVHSPKHILQQYD